MTCATCGKTPQTKNVATETHQVGDHVIVDRERRALVCDCGVLVWDPAVLSNPYPLPYRFPQPGPYYPPNMAPNTATPYTPRLPQITCGGSSLGAMSSSRLTH